MAENEVSRGKRKGDRRRDERRQKERRGPERRHNWPGADRFDYEAELKVNGRRKQGSEKRVTAERRAGERRIVAERRLGPEDRRGVDGTRAGSGRSTDEQYVRRMRRDIPAEASEGVGSVVAMGKRPQSERNMPVGKVPRRPDDVAAHIASGRQPDTQSLVRPSKLRDQEATWEKAARLFREVKDIFRS